MLELTRCWDLWRLKKIETLIGKRRFGPYLFPPPRKSTATRQFFLKRNLFLSLLDQNTLINNSNRTMECEKKCYFVDGSMTCFGLAQLTCWDNRYSIIFLTKTTLLKAQQTQVLKLNFCFNVKTKLQRQQKHKCQHQQVNVFYKVWTWQHIY